MNTAAYAFAVLGVLAAGTVFTLALMAFANRTPPPPPGVIHTEWSEAYAFALGRAAAAATLAAIDRDLCIDPACDCRDTGTD